MKLWSWFFLFGAVYAGEMEKSYRDVTKPPDFSSIPAYYGNPISEKSHPLIEHVQKSIEQAARQKGKLSTEVLEMDGMTSAKGRYLLNHLCSLPNTVYLEIGPWKGSALISALYQNKGIQKAYTIEKWVRFSEDGFDFGNVRNEFHANVRAYLQGLPLKVYEEDCFSFNVDAILEKVTVYFYDGAHRTEDHKKAFTYFNDRFASEFIAVIDDWNWEDTRIGTFEAFDHLGYEILSEQYLPANRDSDKENWWNGMYVAVIRKPK